MGFNHFDFRDILIKVQLSCQLHLTKVFENFNFDNFFIIFETFFSNLSPIRFSNLFIDLLF